MCDDAKAKTLMADSSDAVPLKASRRLLLGASLLLSPLAVAACAGASGVAGSRPPPLPAGLREGEQRPWLLPDTAGPGADDPSTAPYPRMQMAIPAGYASSTQPWPLLIFLHGAGERGADIEDVKRGGPPMLLDQGVPFPMIVCSPQADLATRWQPARLHALVAALSQRFAVDPRRVTATGLSLGGMGVWRWACEYPGDLAAIAPVCGFGDPAMVQAMRHVPVRAYHGDQDPLVPLARQQACIAELRRQGGTASLTIYKGVGHDSWTPAYEDPGLMPWLLAQAQA
jgi:predicted peptidase